MMSVIKISSLENKNMLKKILIVTEYFYPSDNSTSYYITNIAQKLSEKNIVKVICNAEIGISNELNAKNLDIVRVKEVNLNKNNILSRTLKLMISSLRLSILVYKNIDTKVEIFSVTNPAFIIIFLAILKKLKNFNSTLLVYDVFPENLIAAKILKEKSFFYKILKKVYDWAYLKADRLIVIGRDMEEVIRNKTVNSVPIILIENWCDVAQVNIRSKRENILLKKLKIVDKRIFLFAGNLGRVQGIQNMLNAAELVNDENFLLMFIGDGAMKNEIEEHILDSKKKNVVYAGVYPMSGQNIFLNACDVAIVSLSDSMYGLGVPSKSYFNMAAAKPILYIGDNSSEIARVIDENNIGWIVENNNSVELAKKFNEISETPSTFLDDLGIRAREVVANKYSQEIILKKYDELY